MTPRETDRGTWRLVAKRDFWYRLRDKGFMISTGITLLVLTGLILLRAYGGGGTPTFTLGLLGPKSARLGPMVAQAGESQGVTIQTHRCRPGRRRGRSEGRFARRRHGRRRKPARRA